MKKIRSLVIGLGKVGFLFDSKKKKNVLSHVNAISKNKNFDLIAGVDVQEQIGIRFRRSYSVPFFKSLKEFAKKEKCPDLIVISTSTEQKKKIIEEILELKWKPRFILFEKPLLRNIEEKNFFTRKVKKFNGAVNFIWRSFPECEEAKEIFSKFKSKEVVGICFYTDDIFHQGCHCLDLSMYFLDLYRGEPIKFLKYGENYILKSKKIEVTFVKIVKGSRDFNLILKSKNISLNFDGFKQEIVLSRTRKLNIFPQDSQHFLDDIILKFELSNCQKYVYENIYKFLKNKKNNLCHLNYGLRNSELILLNK